MFILQEKAQTFLHCNQDSAGFSGRMEIKGRKKND
jgi:hypothetical protein